MNTTTYKSNHLKDQNCVRIFRGDYIKTYTGIFKCVGQRNFTDRLPLIEVVKLDSELNVIPGVRSLMNGAGECIAKADWDDYIASGQHLIPYELPFNTVEETE
jgi:hypothetical protein